MSDFRVIWNRISVFGIPFWLFRFPKRSLSDFRRIFLQSRRRKSKKSELDFKNRNPIPTFPEIRHHKEWPDQDGNPGNFFKIREKIILNSLARHTSFHFREVVSEWENCALCLGSKQPSRLWHNRRFQISIRCIFRLFFRLFYLHGY